MFSSNERKKYLNYAVISGCVVDNPIAKLPISENYFIEFRMINSLREDQLFKEISDRQNSTNLT